MDEPGAVGAFDFFAEQPDVNVDDVAFGGSVEVVNVLPDVRAGNDPSDIVGEIFKEGILAAAEVDGFAGAANDAVSGVHLEVGDAEDGGLGFILAADHGADAGEQFGENKRFDEIIVGAEFQAVDSVLGGILGGKEQDHGGTFALAKLAKNGQAVDFGEHDVEDDDVVLAVAGVPKRGLPVGGFINGESGLAKALDERLAKRLEIFDDQEAHGWDIS